MEASPCEEISQFQIRPPLRRCTEALAYKDRYEVAFGWLQMAGEMEENMTENSMGGASGEIISKDEFKYFVDETMKAKDNVKNANGNFFHNSVAPKIYQAMVCERDLYMASNNGLDRLNQFDSIADIMGIAHVDDGVETILKERGWKEVQYPCS